MQAWRWREKLRQWEGGKGASSVTSTFAAASVSTLSACLGLSGVTSAEERRNKESQMRERVRETMDGRIYLVPYMSEVTKYASELGPYQALGKFITYISLIYFVGLFWYILVLKLVAKHPTKSHK